VRPEPELRAETARRALREHDCVVAFRRRRAVAREPRARCRAIGHELANGHAGLESRARRNGERHETRVEIDTLDDRPPRRLGLPSAAKAMAARRRDFAERQRTPIREIESEGARFHDARWRDAVAARFRARPTRAIHHEHVGAGSRELDGRGRSARPRTNHEHTHLRMILGRYRRKSFASGRLLARPATGTALNA
jgi:hypothetical protein